MPIKPMKITMAIRAITVYDNQFGDSDSADPSTMIEGGSIIIHRE